MASSGGNRGTDRNAPAGERMVAPALTETWVALEPDSWEVTGDSGG